MVHRHVLVNHLPRHAAPYSGAAETSARDLQQKKRGANTENSSLICRTLSGTHSVTQVGETFIEEWHIPSAFMAQLARTLAGKAFIMGGALCPGPH